LPLIDNKLLTNIIVGSFFCSEHTQEHTNFLNSSFFNKKVIQKLL